MAEEIATIPSPWGEFIRETATLSDGEVLVLDAYVLGNDPEILLRTPDPEVGTTLLPRVAVFFAERSAWQRRATDAVVTRFSEGVPSTEELEDAAHDLVLQTVEVHLDGSVVLHMDDSCGLHFHPGHWPAVRFDSSAAIAEVTVEA